MFLIYLFTSFLLFTNAKEELEGYCDIKVKTCVDEKLEEKFLFYEVNPPEGFNLRRDVYMRFAIMLADSKMVESRKQWSLVLPPWYNLYHWKAQRLAKPIPWATFFQIESLQEFAPVVELHNVFSKTKTKDLEIDRVYILQNYENAYEDGDFSDKWEITKKCNYKPNFWDYKNITAKEIICVYYQGQISKLWELMFLHPTDKSIMFFHGEIPLHNEYGTKTYWDCRKSMKFNKKLVKFAREFMSTHFNCTNKCSNYLSIHWRRRDFARVRKKDIPTIQGTVKKIASTIKEHKLSVNNIFIASDATKSEINSLEKQLKEIGYVVHLLTSLININDFTDGEIAIIEQIICSHAVFFIGTHESTFTYRIQEEREILGLNSNTTFNRFCPDSGYCENPSKWTIVH